MEDNIPFESWWDAYLEGRLSPGDYAAFMQAVKDGHYDEWMGTRIDELLVNNHEGEIRLPDNRAQEILRNIQQSELQAYSLISGARPVYRRWLLPAVAASVLLLSAGLTLLLLPHGNKRSPVAATSGPGHAMAVSTPVKRVVHLPDGSTITLRDSSTLDIPRNFNRVTREVTMSGEGFFQIEHNPDKPFLVHTANLTITVLGTSFNVRAYGAQPLVAVAVASGKVRLSEGKRSLGIILPNQQLEVDKQSLRSVKVSVDADSVVAWKQEYLHLEDLTLADAAAIIASRYQVDVRIMDNNLQGLRITASFLNQERLDHVLDVICQTAGVHYILEDGGKLVEISKDIGAHR